MTQDKRQPEKPELFFWGVFTVCTVIFLWRCFYSVNYYDEPYGIAVMWRYFKGGAILAEDWHPSQQLTAWLLYPLYLFWYTVLGGNGGIILAFRISYVLFQAAATVWCFYRLRNYGYFAAASALLFMFSVHNNMTTLNYNTIGIGCMMLLMTLLFTEESYRPGTMIFAGILMAVIVLAQPYSIFLFFLWGTVVSLTGMFRKNKRIPPLLQMRTFLYAGMGAFFVLIAFLLVVFSRADLKEIVTGVYYNLNDPEHTIDVSYKVSKYFERFYRYYRYQILMIFASAAAGLFREGKLRNLLRAECLLLSTAAFLYTVIYHGWISDYVPIDFIAVPMAFYGIAVFMVSRKKNYKLFFGWLVPAFLYTFCVQFATDTGILAVSAASIMASAGGVLLLAEAWRSEKDLLSGKWKLVCVSALTVSFVLLGSLFLYQRICSTWWSAPVAECTETIERGPAKGIRTTKEDLVWYENALNEIDSLHLGENDRLLVLEHASWLYLYADVPVATYSFWSVGENHFLKEYYELYPEKQPTVVYTSDVEEAIQKNYVKDFLEQGYELTTFDSGNIVLRK